MVGDFYTKKECGDYRKEIQRHAPADKRALTESSLQQLEEGLSKLTEKNKE